MTSRERGIGPFEGQHRPRPGTAERCAQRNESCPQRADDGARFVVCREDMADGRDRVHDVVKAVRVERDHVRGASEVRECVVHPIEVDRAHRAQILRDHHVGIDLGERALVEAIKILALGNPCRHDRRRSPRARALRAASRWKRRAGSALPVGSRTRR